MELPPHLHALATTQLGVLSRRQLTEGGVPAAMVRPRLGSTWRLVLPGVVLLSTALPTTTQRLVAAQLYAGEDSWLAGPTAAALHGLAKAADLESLRRVQVYVPAPKRSRRVDWLDLRRTYLTNERIIHRGPLRLSSTPRALVDAAAATDPSHARAMVVAALASRQVRGADVAHWVAGRERRGRTLLSAALAEAMAGVWSVPEADLRRLLAGCADLPEPMFNPLLHDAQGRRLTTPDVWFDDVGLAVMVHSREFHAEGLDWDATAHTDSDLSSLRVAVVGVTPGAISRSLDAVLRRVVGAHRKAADSGFRPPVTAVATAAWADVA